MIIETIQRQATEQIRRKLKDGRVLLVHGPRRVGKTTLLRQMKDQSTRPVLWLNGESQATHRLLEDRSEANYRNVVGNNTLVIIDEAQVIPDIGRVLKFMVDELPHVQFLISGSATFDILNRGGEPLTGRFRIVKLYPVSVPELLANRSYIDVFSSLEDRLVYGTYPEILRMETIGDKQEYLTDLIHAYLLKDLLAVEGLRQTSKLLDLLRMLAYQIGQEVSLEELGKGLGMSKNTVEKYLHMLEQIFVLKRLTGFSKNLRKEIVKTSRWMFLDNGIRNAVIGDFRPVSLRNDQGALWENAMAAERLKWLGHTESNASTYFWRTYDHQELDWVEEENAVVSAFEFKWKLPSRFKTPGAFSKAYPDAKVACIHQENYLEWLALPKSRVSENLNLNQTEYDSN